MMTGEYYLHLYLRDPDYLGWVDIPCAVKLICEGIPTATGHVFDYDKGNGWVFLSRESQPQGATVG